MLLDVLNPRAENCRKPGLERALGAFELDNSPTILTPGLSGLLQKNIKSILTSFVPVVYCSSQANISLNYKYLCIALYLRADLRVQVVFTIAFTYSFQHS